jgi:diguanylate cyclase (GGDEF)-like protein
LVILAAVGAILFICASAFLVYNNTQQLITSRDWRDHSQEVLNTLQLSSQRLDRIELASRLYLIDKDRNDLAMVQSNAIALDSGLTHLEELVKDNAAQASRARSMDRYVADLRQMVNNAQPPLLDPLQDILGCRGVISKMQEAERTLLAQRTEESRQSTYRSLLAGAVFLAISLAMVMTLFAFLLRDARRRQKTERQISQTNMQLESTVATLRQRASEATLLMAAREEMQLCTGPAQAHEATVRYCRQLAPSTCSALLMINNSRQMVEIVAVSEGDTRILDGFPLDACCGLRSGRLRWRKPGQSEVHCGHFLGISPESYLCIPLAAHGDTLGVLYIECPTPQAASEVDNHLESLQQLAEMASMSIASLNLRSRLEHQSIRDGLTNLFNRHFMEISLDREVRRAARNHTELAILMIDVDHFKKFNDSYGHEAGDSILREVAEIFRQSVRAEDIICRYGGEEFVIILPETSSALAIERAEAIRWSVSQMRVRFRTEALREITVSVGVAICPGCGSTLEEILRSADRALYAAKHAGRNQIMMAESLIAAR